MQTINLNRIAFHTSKGISYFEPQQIIRLEAKSNYTRIFLSSNKSILLAKVLKEFESQLLPFGFIRTHRSHLVNKNLVMKVSAGRSVIMNDDSVAEISRSKKLKVLKELSN